MFQVHVDCLPHVGRVRLCLEHLAHVVVVWLDVRRGGEGPLARERRQSSLAPVVEQVTVVFVSSSSSAQPNSEAEPSTRFVHDGNSWLAKHFEALQKVRETRFHGAL